MPVIETLNQWSTLIATGTAFMIGVFGWRLGQAKNSWRLESLEHQVKTLEQGVEILRDQHYAFREETQKQQGLMNSHLQVIQVSLEQIKTLLDDLKQELKQKQDK